LVIRLFSSCSYQITDFFKATALRDLDFLSKRLEGLPTHQGKLNESYTAYIAGLYPEIGWDHKTCFNLTSMYLEDFGSARWLANFIWDRISQGISQSEEYRSEEMVGGQADPKTGKLRRPSFFFQIIASGIVAFTGRTLTIVPMIIMSFNSGRTRSLVTTSVAVILSWYGPSNEALRHVRRYCNLRCYTCGVCGG
jgi:hypothetical protein